jgi:hypothetical protein
MGRWVHKKKGLQMRGITRDRAKRGSQCDGWKIRVPRRVGGSIETNSYK